MNKKIFVAALAATSLSTLGHAQVNFTDNFTPASSQWSNTSGDWTSSGGQYYAQHPNNNPFAVTWLPYNMTDFTINVHVNNLADCGILLRGSGDGGGGTTGPDNTIVLILGGNGYGQGNRGGNAGTSAYFHVDGSGATDEVDGVFTPGDSYDLKITVIGDTYSLYVNGSTTATTTLTTSLNSHGFTGLYDDQPNDVTGSGSGPYSAFSNYSLTGELVPEPSGFALLGLGVLALPFLRKRS